jgi:hypothetical protein
MRDELFDRDYQAGRAALNDGIDRLLRRLGNELAAVFRAVHRIQWSAPWTGHSR